MLDNTVACAAFCGTLLLVLALATSPAHAFGAMSVDLGSEWIKVGVVAPGVPMDIALSIEGERKIPTAVAFSDNKTVVGYQALKIGARYPERVLTHFLDLAGKATLEHESVQHYLSHFPAANLSLSPFDNSTNTSSVVINLSDGIADNITVTPLELLTHIFQHAHYQVSQSLPNERIDEIVITVPPFFEWDERRIVRQAAKNAGLKVLKLMHTNSAFALSYGVFRHTDEEYTKNSSVMFFDQGASFSSLTIADFNLTQNNTLPTITIRNEVYDRKLGGFDMELRFRDYLARAFSKQTGIELERVLARSRSMFKLLQEAKRVKKVLSANVAYNVRIENVIDDQDFMMPVTREDYENLCAELMDERVVELLKKLDGETIPELLIIIGGNTRTPKVQQVLKQHFPTTQLGKFVNADEGATLAALYQAASLVPGFKVKQYSLIEYPREPDPVETEAPVTEFLRTIFGNDTNLLDLGEKAAELLKEKHLEL